MNHGQRSFGYARAAISEPKRLAALYPEYASLARELIPDRPDWLKANAFGIGLRGGIARQAATSRRLARHWCAAPHYI